MEKGASDIFLGIQISAPIRNQRRYETVINLLLQYLDSHR